MSWGEILFAVVGLGGVALLYILAPPDRDDKNTWHDCSF
jgi:uncharacterized membrane protein YuzA (DUF378 family)